MSSLEERFGRALGELQVLERFILELQTRVNTLRAFTAEYDNAINFIEELKKTDGKMRLLVPIGAGNYVHADITDVTKIEVSVGAGVVITKSVEESLELMKKRKENLLKAIEENENQLVQYAQRAAELRRLVEALAAKIKEKMGESGSESPRT